MTYTKILMVKDDFAFIVRNELTSLTIINNSKEQQILPVIQQQELSPKRADLHSRTSNRW